MAKKVLVDASAFLAVVLEESEKALIIEATRGCQILTAGCLRWEIGNAFSAMLKRNRLTYEEVKQGIESFQRIAYEELEVGLEEAMEIANRHGIYAYDAYYLAAASRRGLELLSLDKPMLEVARKEGIKIKELKELE
jgi:predicted nucleic acid-binding protein